MEWICCVMQLRGFLRYSEDVCVCVRACVAVKELCVAVLLIWVFDTERSVCAAVKVCVYVAVK